MATKIEINSGERTAGRRRFRRLLQTTGPRAVKDVGQAMFEFGSDIQAQAQDRAPLRTGT